MEKLMNCELHIYIHDARRSYDVSIVKLDGIRIVERVIAARCCLQPTTSRRNEQWKRKKKAESLNNSSKVKVVGCELQLLIVAHLDETSPSTDKNDNWPDADVSKSMDSYESMHEHAMAGVQ
jgi:hypothetical protein